MARPGSRSPLTEMMQWLLPRTWRVCGTLPSERTVTKGSSAYFSRRIASRSAGVWPSASLT
eukprot:5486251-Pleurochrysis_carterae.AAC.9